MTNHILPAFITQRLSLHVLLLGLVSFNCVRAQEGRIVIQADRPGPRISDRWPGNAGLIVHVDQPGDGADNFAGYEISLDAAAQTLRLGRHRHNWEPIQDTRCSVPTGAWIPLVVKLNGSMLEVLVNGASVIRHDDGTSTLRSCRR